MREDIKKRWEMIQRGEIPKGYKKERNKIIPKEWDLKRLDDLVDRIVGGGTPSRNKPHYYGGDIPWATVKDLSEDNYKEATLEYISREGVENSSTKIIEKHNFIISTRMGLGRGFINKVDMAINQDLKGLYPNKRKLDVVYLMYWYKNSSALFERLGVGSTVKGINLKTLKNMMIPHPSIKEQRKIAQILSTWDEAIDLKEKLIEEKQEQKKGLMQNLLTGKVRLPGFEGEWEEVRFSKIFNRISAKKHQIKTSEYLNKGLYPVVDQGKEKIIAYSNQEEKVFKVDYKGLIVFGDHTREIKFIDFDFIIGADGTQILQTKEGCDTKFYYYHLLIKRVPDTGYNRHFKFLKEMKFFYPSIQEQKAIADVLSTADREIELLKEEVELLKEQKKGLMQLLLTGIVRVDEAIL